MQMKVRIRVTLIITACMLTMHLNIGNSEGPVQMNIELGSLLYSGISTI